MSEKVDANKDDGGSLWSKMGYTNKDLGPSWGKRVDGNKDHLGVKRMMEEHHGAKKPMLTRMLEDRLGRNGKRY